MTAFLAELKKVVSDLDGSSAPWCLIGGLACSVYSDPRTTKDIDVAIALDTQQEIESLVARLENAGYMRRQLLMHVSPTHRLGWRLFIPTTSSYEIPLDLLISSSGIEREVVGAATSIEILPSLHVPVASRSHLIAMKVVSENQGERIRDRVDLEGLIATSTDSDILGARDALKLITERGYDRGKDLLAVLDELLK